MPKSQSSLRGCFRDEVGKKVRDTKVDSGVDTISDKTETKGKREKLLARIKNFRLLDDDFMTKCFEDSIECTELILQIILERDDMKVKMSKTQYSQKNLKGRSVRLDIYAEDTENKKYDIEIQRDDHGAGRKRARYNSAILDSEAILPNQSTKDLPESYVIFITENDIFKEGLPLYHVDRYVKETGKAFGDEEHIIYVNGAYRGDSPLGKLMYDFSCKNPDDMYYSVLAKQMRYFKEDKEGVAAMCKVMEELIDDEKAKEKKEAASRFIRAGKLSLAEIADGLDLSLEIVESIAREL